MARTRLYRNGDLVAEDFPIDDISDHLQAGDTVVWLDLAGPSKEDFERVQEEFGLHELAIEDASSPRERPKLLHYSGHLFLSAYATEFDAEEGELTGHKVSAFLTDRALVTVHDEDFDIDPVVQRWDATPELAAHGVAYLVHGLLDVIVDGHFDTVQELDDALEELEDILFDEAPQSLRKVQQRTFKLRRGLGHLRKIVLPMREVVNGLQRAPLITDELRPYYQDLFDHVLRAAEWTESLRDFTATILDSNLAVQGNRQNSVMKKVTSWAAIIAVPTAVTGYYGQNLPFPGFEHFSGFVTSAVLIVVLSIGLYVTFKRKDWL